MQETRKLSCQAGGVFLPILMIMLLLTASGMIFIQGRGLVESDYSSQIPLKTFSSYEELVDFIRMNSKDFALTELNAYYDTSPQINILKSTAIPADSERDYVRYRLDPSNSPDDYSTTNIQVKGVDEADIVKTDGKYIYVVSKNKVIIIDAYPAENARILSKINESENPREIFINEDKLVVLGWRFVRIYDVSDREDPQLVRNVSFDGWYFNSRMIGSYVYVIINSPTISRWTEETDLKSSFLRLLNMREFNCWTEKIDLPTISSNGRVRTIPATEIHYFENLRDYSYEFTTIMAINTQNDDEKITSETFLLGVAQNIYVSLNNVYITYTNSSRPILSNANSAREVEKTIIHKISIANGEIKYRAQGEVPGRVLNQFSMDEYQGYFRIATTTGHVRRAGNGAAQNHVFILSRNLNIIGRLENLASGERIYSARFIGDRAYLVTFKKVDPLFVIDLSNPRNPEILGKLKIPGYSDYLHPYDKTHLIGIGKEAEDVGSFAWYQGVKVALFDVSDVNNPKQISKFIIGDRGTESPALRDHRALLFSKPKNLLVLPITLAEIDEDKYSNGVPPNARGDYTWQGAYVFHINPEDGINLKGRITHRDGIEDLPPCYCFTSPYSIKRSLYVEDSLYTFSEKMIKINSLRDLQEVNEIEF